jgi:hypothetical protein
MDCPYYERLQYIGDARIQMMISYYNSGDDRQPKNALNLWDNSRQKDKFSQHANSLAIIAGLVDGQKASEIGKLMLSDVT